MNYNYSYDPNSYMNPYPQITYPTYRSTNSTTNQSSVDLTKVQSIEDARAYPCPPNSRIVLFDGNDDIMYIKSTDANNFPTVRKYRFYEEIEVEPEDKFVTIDEFKKFKEEILNAQQSVRNNHKSNNKQSND